MNHSFFDNHFHSFGLDFLEVYASFLNEDYFQRLFSHSNSSPYCGFYWDFDAQLFQKKEAFEYQIVFSQNNRALFVYFKWKPNNYIPTKSYVVFYLAIFRKFWENFVMNFLFDNFILEDSPIKRFDIYADFTICTEEFLQEFFVPPQKTATFTDEKWKVETFYIWQVQNTKNKRNLIRIYNKINEIRKNEKIALYQDYLLYDNITRIELEMRRKLTKNYTLEELFVRENQYGIMKIILQNIQIFLKIFQLIRLHFIKSMLKLIFISSKRMRKMLDL